MRLDYQALREAVDRERARVAATGLTRFALLADNGIGWVIADLALYLERLINVPLPAYFTDAQLLHVLDDAGVEALLTGDPARAQALLPHWFDAGTVGPAGLALRLRPRGAITALPVPLGTRQGHLHIGQYRCAERGLPRCRADRDGRAVARRCDAIAGDPAAPGHPAVADPARESGRRLRAARDRRDVRRTAGVDDGHGLRSAGCRPTAWLHRHGEARRA